jgi:hypothetical protein
LILHGSESAAHPAVRPAYQTENETSSSDERKRKSSRRRRLHLAHLIGVTASQMQMGLMEAVL